MSLTYQIDRHRQLDSTNLEAMRQAQAGATAGLVVIADSQSAGRGRHGRTWQSPEGNLFISILLQPEISPCRLGELAFVSALAAADTVDAFAGAGRAKLKWPNDVLVDNAKICGVLIENSISPPPDGGGREAYGAAISRTGEGKNPPSPAALSHAAKSSASPIGEREFGVDWSVVGIGLNIASAPTDTPYPATCLAALGADCTRDQVADTLLQSFAARYDQWLGEGFAAIRAEWLAHAWNLGAPIVVEADSARLTGQFYGIDDSGALLLATDRGTQRVVSGTLANHRPAA